MDIATRAGQSYKAIDVIQNGVIEESIDILTQYVGVDMVVGTIDTLISLLESSTNEDINEYLISQNRHCNRTADAAAKECLLREFADKAVEGTDNTELYLSMLAREFKGMIDVQNDAGKKGYVVTARAKSQDGEHQIVSLTNIFTGENITKEGSLAQVMEKLEPIMPEEIPKTYDIPSVTFPTEEKPDKYVPVDFLAFLDASRNARKYAKKNNAHKGMVTRDGTTRGTGQKFRDVYERLPNTTKVLLIGSGPLATSGMVMEAAKKWGKKNLVCVDPKAVQSTYAGIEVHVEEFDFHKDYGATAIVSDVSIGRDNTFDIEYTTEFAKKISKYAEERKMQFVVYKEDITNITRRRCDSIHYGRGHNNEIIVAKTPGQGLFVSRKAAEEVTEQKRICNVVRNLAIFLGIHVPRPFTVGIPAPPRTKGALFMKHHKKNKHRTAEYSIDEMCTIIGGLQTSDNLIVRGLSQATVYLSMQGCGRHGISATAGSLRQIQAGVDSMLGGRGISHKKKRDKENKGNPSPRKRAFLQKAKSLVPSNYFLYSTK